MIDVKLFCGKIMVYPVSVKHELIQLLTDRHFTVKSQQEKSFSGSGDAIF